MNWELAMALRCRSEFLMLAAAMLLAAPCAAQSDTRLLDAVKRRDHKAAQSLVRAHADVNAAQRDGATALAWAVHLGDRDMADLLLTAGAKVDLANEYGETPLTLACAMPISGVLMLCCCPPSGARVSPDGVETSRKRASW